MGFDAKCSQECQELLEEGVEGHRIIFYVYYFVIHVARFILSGGHLSRGLGPSNISIWHTFLRANWFIIIFDDEEKNTA